jgi:hypothetical protein
MNYQEGETSRAFKQVGEVLLSIFDYNINITLRVLVEVYVNMNVEMGQDQFIPQGPFSDKIIRMEFVRKVYSILSVQLVISFGIMLIFNLNDYAKQYAISHQLVGFVIALISIIPLVSLVCCVSRTFPINIIALTVFAIMEGCALGFIGAAYQTHVILMIIGLTAIVVLSLTMFACQTTIDFTPFSGGMIAIFLTLLGVGIIAAIFQAHWITVLYAGLGTIVFTIYLIMDTQMIMGGRSQEVNPEDYILAVVMLYVDIINLFLFLLQLFGNK